MHQSWSLKLPFTAAWATVSPTMKPVTLVPALVSNGWVCNNQDTVLSFTNADVIDDQRTQACNQEDVNRATVSHVEMCRVTAASRLLGADMAARAPLISMWADLMLNRTCLQGSIVRDPSGAQRRYCL